jgi:hypothetical protein
MKRQADEFENALERSERGEPIPGPQAPLVQTASSLKSLSEAPPPPHGLVRGRQRFLAEAARLREETTARRRPTLVLRLATAAAALLVLFGVYLGAARVSASSLPADPLYGVKRAAERVRLALTIGPQGRSARLEAMAEERMGEILALLEQGRAIDESVSGEAARQLQQALVAAAMLEDAAAPLALQKLAEGIRRQEAAIRRAAGESPDFLVSAFLREMERVREEALLGQGDPDGLRERLRQGEPSEPTDLPRATPRPSSSMTPSERPPSVLPGSSTAPRRTGMPTASPEPSGTPHQTPAMTTTPRSTGGPHATNPPQPSVTSQPTGGPPASQIPGATVTPQGAHGTPTPGQGGTATPTTNPGGTPAQTPGGGGGNKP